ncbi:hypothetical protein CI109_100831 [Kwoniella shandongensis]|uniref:Uncharacterized protein n=1 Tax=Kwoniella shandongensis TaxID=1734106 RepID=A0A5M6BPU4_9TREE|nr:uncharacterized protein CI109_006921 [Kwoniella shandongensis]KAA5524767.1 hypothetical protein CI109_006921 [Kwoniella shandongensis]
MAILAKPSRSYANVEHSADGLGAVGTGPYTAESSKKSSKKVDGGFKTYRPPLAETHLRRPLGYDPHPTSHFAPLPPAFHLSNKHKKDQALAGQRAELDHILQPGYKSFSGGMDGDGDSASIAGPSRHSTSRTAGGLNGASDRKGKTTNGLGLRPSASISSFNAPSNGASSRRAGALGGIYIDSNGKVHDTEFDPFQGVAEMSRAKSRRRSAFGADRRKGGDSTSSSETGSETGDVQAPRRSTDTGRETKDEEEIRRRLEIERKRLDDVSGYAAARRRSMMSERSGRGTPSIRSSEDGPLSAYSASVAPSANRAKSQAGHYVPSPLSPTFTNGPSSASMYSARTTPISHDIVHRGEGTPPEKSTETTARHKPETKSKVEVTKDGSKKITGFDAPITPVLPTTPSFGNHLTPSLHVPDSARHSTTSRGSSDIARERERERLPKPTERPREELFPETPAQIKRREERERRAGGRNALSSRATSLAVDTALATAGTTSRSARILPEIEIVEDDDPRIVFPPEGKATRVQTHHDHVIRGPFSHALNAQGGGGSTTGPLSERRPSSTRSFNVGGGVPGSSGSKPPSTLIDEDGGYLPSRWRNGDKSLRVTEDDREMYRPTEWKHGDLTGKTEEWKPGAKDAVKRNLKDIATSARFSLFRTKKKLLRKAEM